jgi:hypothetical protein
MVVFEGIVSVPLVSEIVCAAANAVESKVMLAEPWPAAKSSASRRLHEASVPVPGVVWIVQFEVVPASSFAVVTTRVGIVTLIFPLLAVRLFTESVAVMVCVPAVSMVAENVPVPLLIVPHPGRIALGSLLVKATAPPYAIATLPPIS